MIGPNLHKKVVTFSNVVTLLCLEKLLLFPNTKTYAHNTHAHYVPAPVGREEEKHKPTICCEEKRNC